MTLDECLRYPAAEDAAEAALMRTTRWARRCRDARRRSDQLLFGIVQGAHYPGLRACAAAALVEIGFDGYALGGLSVGEDKEVMHAALDAAVAEMPESAPRYLMVVRTPEALIERVAHCMDMFVRAIPTRHGLTELLCNSFELGRI